MNSEALSTDAQAPCRRYLNLLPELERARQEVRRLEEELKTLEQVIGDRLAPDDACLKETFHMWIRWPADNGREVLLAVQCVDIDLGVRNFKVSIRWPKV